MQNYFLLRCLFHIIPLAPLLLLLPILFHSSYLFLRLISMSFTMSSPACQPQVRISYRQLFSVDLHPTVLTAVPVFVSSQSAFRTLDIFPVISIPESCIHLPCSPTSFHLSFFYLSYTASVALIFNFFLIFSLHEILYVITRSFF